MNFITLDNISVEKSGKSILKNVSCQIPKGKTTTLLGASGSGKTTLLRVISGLDTPHKGMVYIQGKLASQNKNIRLSPDKRQLSYMLQSGGLFPHFSLLENMLFVDYSEHTIKEKKEKALQILRELNIDSLKNKYPHELSGGEQQRASLACILQRNTDLILLDEPFSHLDKNIREILRSEMFDILKLKEKTILMVTHDPEEAMFVSDHMILLRQGGVIQAGSPHYIYSSPKSQDVLSFFGHYNPISLEGNIKYIRPHSFTLSRKEGLALNVTLQDIRFMGSYYHCLLQSQKKEKLIAYLTEHEISNYQKGDTLCVFVPQDQIFSL